MKSILSISEFFRFSKKSKTKDDLINHVKDSISIGEKFIKLRNSIFNGTSTQKSISIDSSKLDGTVALKQVNDKYFVKFY